MEGNQDKYHVNLFTLNFNVKSVKDSFNKSFYKEDLYALRFVIGLGILLSLAFIFVDIQKYEDPWTSILFRGGMALILALFAYLSSFISEERFRYTQYYGISVSLIVIIGFYVHYHFNTDPKFDIFLSNILTVMVYVIATITGLRFRFAFLIITLTILGYFIYIPFFNYSAIASRQLTQMIVVYLFTILSSYVLERQKINLFINRSILAEEKTKVEALDTVKNKLFSIVSHDLRSPIQSLKGFLNLLNKDAISQQEFKELSKNLEEKLVHTSYLMDNLLAWSKSQMEGITLNQERFSIQKEIKYIASGFHLDLEKKNIEIKYVFYDDFQLIADKEMFHIAIRNLISNAIKFTPYSGKINIEGYSDRKFLHLFIKDNGSGISKEKLANIFKIKNDSLIGNIQSEGAGLGLLLVKEFTELNNGKVVCESQLGKGTQFILKFPISE